MGFLALLAVSAFMLPVGSAQAADGCQAKDIWPVAKRAWQRMDGPRRSESERKREIRQCSSHPYRVGKKWRAGKRRFAPLRAEKREVRALLIYEGGGKRWAIPAEIVACESGYEWGAANPSGAVGPYQLLGKGAPYPVNDQEDKREHHLIAGNLYAGGAGRRHWVC